MTVQLARLETSGARVLVARIAGEIDMSNASDLQRAVLAQLTNQAAGLVLDLTDVLYLDSAAIHAIYDLRGQLSSRGIALRLVVPAEAPTTLALRLTGVPDIVDVHASVSDAEASIP